MADSLGVSGIFFCQEWSGSHGCGACGDAGGVVDIDDVAAFGDCVYSAFEKKKR